MKTQTEMAGNSLAFSINTLLAFAADVFMHDKSFMNMTQASTVMLFSNNEYLSLFHKSKTKLLSISIENYWPQ